MGMEQLTEELPPYHTKHPAPHVAREYREDQRETGCQKLGADGNELCRHLFRHLQIRVLYK